MPFFMFMTLINLMETDQQKRSGRKYMVDAMRYTSKKFGWT